MSLLHVASSPSIRIDHTQYDFWNLHITLDGKPFGEWPGLAFAADDVEGWMDFYKVDDKGCVIRGSDNNAVVFRVHGKVEFKPRTEQS